MLSSPLKKAKNNGSAHHGHHHWWLQRLSAIALIPLSIFLLFSIATTISHYQGDSIIWYSWVKSPFNSLLLGLFFIIAYSHASLGLQVVIEDYISPSKRLICLILVKLLSYFMMAMSITALIIIMLG